VLYREGCKHPRRGPAYVHWGCYCPTQEHRKNLHNVIWRWVSGGGGISSRHPSDYCRQGRGRMTRQGPAGCLDGLGVHAYSYVVDMDVLRGNLLSVAVGS
jgi:hypothetical protein